MLVATMASGMLATASMAQVMPSGGKVTAGSAGITTRGNTTTISQSSNKAIIDWQAFSIGQGGTVQFNNGTGATLNRVTGSNLSSIDGLLSATGSVYLINPNGVIIGKSGVVKTGGGFVASTLDIDNTNFLNGGDLTLAGTSLASVVNLGQIGALGGDVALVAANVRNDGSVVAPNGTLGLLAGSRVLMRDATVNDGKFLVLSGGAGTSVTNTGTIDAAAAELRAEGGNVYALAGNTSGLIRATGVTASDGRIYLTAGGTGSVKVSGSTLKAADAAGNGGTISVTGGYVAVASDATLDASAIAANGNGGTVSTIADMTAGQLDFQGTALAEGGVNGGNGGSVETSGHSVNFDGARINTSAAGKSGTWLIDPDDLTVDSASAATIDSSLANTDVTLQTTATTASGTGVSTSGNGDIIVNSDLTWSSGHVLTLDAYHSIQFNANLTASGAGGVVLKTNDGGTGGDYAFALGKSLSFTGSGGALTINSSAYTLVYSLSDMAGMGGSSHTGHYYALATDLTGTAGYSNTVVSSLFGTFTGLGHAVNDMALTGSYEVGLFGEIEYQGTVRDIGTSGSVIGRGDVGGLAGYSAGIIQNAYSSASVTSNASGSDIGGLVGNNAGTVSNSFATGTVNGSGGGSSQVGGLVGLNQSTIRNTYATGAVSGGSYVGGLVGESDVTVSNSFATGQVTASGSNVGGLAGYASTYSTTTNDYYDEDTTGLVGSPRATGEHTSALQSATLPSGFDSTVWGAASGYYPWLKTFQIPQVVSGYAYNGDGSAASGAALGVYTGGVLLSGAAATSGANGYYYINVAAHSVGSTTKVGVIETLSGQSVVSGAIYTDAPTLSGADVTGLNVTSGVFSYTTADTSYSALKADATATFGSIQYGSLLTSLASASEKVYASGAFTLDTSLDTTGSALIKTSGGDLTIDSDVTVSGGNALTLDSYGNLSVNANLTASGANAVTLTTGDGGSGDYSFALGKSLSFTSTGGSLTINGNAYTLLTGMTGIANLNGQSGRYALATDLTSSSSYTDAVAATFSGTFTGLGHTIHNLTINSTSGNNTGLFGYNSGTIRDIGLSGGSISGTGSVGALVGDSFGTIENTWSSASVSGTGAFIGGLVGSNEATLTNSFATGNVNGDTGNAFQVGGLVGNNSGTITNAYATGAVSGNDRVGGLVGENDGTVTNSLATGQVTATSEGGGLVGADFNGGTSGFYDTDTAGQTGGLGTGYTTAQLQSSSLSALGLDATVWATGSGLYPYLKSFFPNGVQVISGTTLTSTGAAAAQAGIGLYDNGTSLGTAVSGANGYYYALFAPGTIAGGAGVGATLKLNGDTTFSGMTYTLAASFSSGKLSGFDIAADSVSASQLTDTTFSAFGSHAFAGSVFGNTVSSQVSSDLAFQPLAFHLSTTGAFTVDGAPSYALFIKSGGDLTVASDISVNDTRGLTLDAHDNLYINANITVSGADAVTLKAADGGGGDYSFLTGKSLSFTNTAGAGQSLTINGHAYTLLYSMADLPNMDFDSGYYALAKPLDASGTTYTYAVIRDFEGTFTGLGNTISHLTINAPTTDDMGLVDYNEGTLRDIGLVGGTVYGHFYSGALVGENDGLVQNTYSSVDMHVAYRSGGLVGLNQGIVTQSHATGSVTSNGDNGSGVSDMGGLVGWNQGGDISLSYATGTVTAISNTAGGLVAFNDGGIVENSFATGGVFGNDYAGGLVGFGTNGATITTSFATGYVHATSNGGGLVGHFDGTIADSYWDTTNSGMMIGVGDGTGSSITGTGATGLSRATLQSGSLPTNFSSSIWATGSGLYPYLKSIFPTGVEAISGTALAADGTAVPAANVRFYTGGAQLAATASGADGYYYVMTAAGTVGSTTPIAVSETLHGDTSASGIGYTDLPTLTGGQATGFDVRSGRATLNTSATAIGVLNNAVSASFGAGTYTAIQTGMSTADTYITAHTSFKFMQAATFGGGLWVTAPSGISLNTTLGTAGTTVFANAVTLTGNATINAGSGAVTFASTVNGAFGLTVNTSGATTFGGAVGGTTALASLTTNAGGTTSLGGNVRTSGGQTFNDAVILAADATLTSTGNNAITLASTVNGAHALTVNTTGATTFGGAVGGTTALASLTTDAGGTTTLGGNITASGAEAFNDAVTLAANAALTAGGSLTLASTVTGATHSLTLSGTSLSFGGAVNGVTTLTGAATAGDIDVGGQITTTGAIQLAAYGNFVNTAGATALNPGTNFTVYTQNASNPTGVLPGDTFNGLTATNYYNDAYDFTHGTFASAVPTGNHFVYGYAASLTPTLSGSASKGYNGDTVAGTSGLTIGDGSLLSVNDSVGFAFAGASFDTRNAGSGKTVTASGISLSSNPNNYSLASTTASAAIGSISKATLTLAAVTDTRTYDGETDSSGTVSATGLQNGDSLTGLTQAFASKNVLGSNGSTLSVTGYNLSDGNNGGNYNVITQAATGTITKATLTLSAVTDSRTYDGGIDSSGTVSVNGLQTGDSLTGVTQAFGSKNVLGTNGSTLSVTGYSLGDSNNGGNYNVVTQAATGTIRKATLTLAAVTDSRTYDGDIDSSGTVSVTGLQTGDSLTGATQAFGSRNVLGTNGSTLAVTGYNLSDGNGGGNYTVVTDTASGTITKATLTLAAVTDTKTYDASTTSDSTVDISGLRGSDTVTGDTQSFTSKNVMGANDSTVAVNDGYAVNDGNNGGNYAVTTQTASGTINQAALTLAAVNATKTYDTTTASTGTVQISGLQGSDTVTGDTQSFTSKNVLGTGGSTLAVNSGYSVNDGNNGGNYAITTQTAAGTINQAALTLAAVTATNTYDATTASTGTVQVSGLQGSDTVTGASQSFDSKNAGSRTLSVGGYTVNDGNNGGNYAVATQTASGTINQAALTLAAVTATKTYDATTASTGTVQVSGLQGSDTVSGASQSFDSKNAGSRTLSVGGYTVNDGNNGGNYAVTTQTAAGTINQAALTLAAVTATKTYDATTASTGTVQVSGLQGSDTVTGASQSFDSRNAGSRTLSVGGYTVNDGNNGGNYAVTTQTAAGTINQAALTLAAVTATKTYDATTASTGTVQVSGLQGADTVTGALQSFDSRNAGSRRLSVGGYTVNDGNNGANYAVATRTASGTITPAALIASLTGTTSKTYDASLTALLTAGNYSLTGLKGSDTVGLNDPTTGVYADVNAGTGKSVSVTGLALTGLDAGNYTVNGFASANIGIIALRDLTISADTLGKFAGAADPALTYQISSGSVAGNDSLTGGLARTSGENPGVYDITQGSLAASANYDVTFVKSAFTVTAVALQNDPVVNPVSSSSNAASQPVIQSAPIGLNSTGPTSSDASTTTSSGNGSAKDAGSNAGNGDEKATGPNIQAAGQTSSACTGDGCSNAPYPTNQVISSSISFSQ